MSNESTNPYAAPGPKPRTDFFSAAAGDSDELNVSFEFTEDDFVLYNLFVHRRRKTIRRSFLLVLFFSFIAAGLVLLSWGGGRREHLLEQLPFFLIIASFVLSYPFLLRRSIKKSVQRLVQGGKNRYLFGRKRVTLRTEELVESGEYSELRLRWQVVEETHKTPDGIYIFMSNIQAIIVPRSAFLSDAAYDDFFARLERFVAGATESE